MSINFLTNFLLSVFKLFKWDLKVQNFYLKLSKDIFRKDLNHAYLEENFRFKKSLRHQTQTLLKVLRHWSFRNNGTGRDTIEIRKFFRRLQWENTEGMVGYVCLVSLESTGEHYRQL